MLLTQRQAADSWPVCLSLQGLSPEGCEMCCWGWKGQQGALGLGWGHGCWRWWGVDGGNP